MRITPGVALLAAVAFAQTFDVASVKPSRRAVGKDARGAMVFEPTRVSARNVSLKGMIAEAYGVQPFQVTGGAGWLDLDEFDLDARANKPSTRAQLDAMLQATLAERFQLVLHRESKEMRVYALSVEKSGPKLRATAGETRPSTGPQNFHGDLRQFANLISIQLSIPTIEDPTRPAIASGAPVPVIDKTGIEGNYDLGVDLHLDPGGDSFTSWQRALHDQLGLKLESQRAPVELLVVEHADRVPAAN